MDEFLLTMDKDGVFHEYKEPFTTVECETEEDFECLKAAVEHYRKRGRWEKRDGKTWCSLCGASNKAYEPPYCPHCGARMNGGGE